MIMRTRLMAMLLLGALLWSPSALAQEFNCVIRVDYRSLTGSDYSFLDELQEDLFEYMNDRQWTDDRFDDEERIDCSMQLLFTSAPSLTQFRARLVLASRRPIYGSAQQTQVLTLSDEEVQFEYSQGTPLIYQPDQYDPLTSVLNFYAHIMLGFDYDTFEALGGEPLFIEARRIAELGEQRGALGWSSLGGGQSRGELISQILDSRFRPLRQIYFDYHFGMLDHFIDEPEESREKLLQTVNELQALREDVTRAYYLDQFFAAKYSEMIRVFNGSSQASQAFDALSQIDPAHLSDYSTMMN
jgi:hypothetical protein